MTPISGTPAVVSDREKRIQQLLDQLRPAADEQLRAMVEALVDTVDEKPFGEIEFTLRDQAHQLAATAHQAALENLDSGKKGGTAVPLESVPTAKPTTNSLIAESEMS